ncbi:hypothetical protein FRC12_005640 [Ceratobasidium sp. 428]|nr:hypothetical protein FRC09_005061 [Ceratobasidium sp. 395]KAG8768334.1 hypothetical protein FRC12_005640 [Ceratobasidium sp. 428]
MAGRSFAPLTRSSTSHHLSHVHSFEGFGTPPLNEKLFEDVEASNALNWFSGAGGAGLSSQETVYTENRVLNETSPYTYHSSKSSTWSDASSTIQLRGRNNDELLSLCPPKLTAEYPTPLTPAESKVAIEEVIETLDLISVAFMWPDHLDFLHTSLGSIPDLADTRQNAAWIQQQGRLFGLATELQYIPTYGSTSLQKAHAEATDLVEKELCELDAFKSRLWEKVRLNLTGE